MLRQHMLTHKVQKRFWCNVCGKGFNLLHHLKNHEKTHENKPEFECNICKKCFLTKEKLASHLKRHMNLLRCSKCSKAFPSDESLASHLLTHNSDNVYVCPTCGEVFEDLPRFNRHQKSHNAEDSRSADNEGVRVMCLVCNIHFVGELELREHMKSHTNQLICKTCNRSFLQENTLQAHMRSHTLRDFTCGICMESFSRADHLKLHISRKHREGNDDELQYECSYCKKRFMQMGELNIHIRTHTRFKPYFCATCGRNFAQSNQVRRFPNTSFIYFFHAKIFQRKSLTPFFS